MKILIVVISLFALFFSVAGYVRVKHPEVFNSLQYGLFSSFEKDTNSVPANTVTTSNDNKTSDVNSADSTNDIMLTPGVYEEYSPEKVARAATAPVVLFFYASWCPSCTSTDRIFLKKIASLPPGVSILKIDYDTATELKQRYGVTYQHTFIQVDSTGSELTRWSGGAIDGLNANLIR